MKTKVNGKMTRERPTNLLAVPSPQREISRPCPTSSHLTFSFLTLFSTIQDAISIYSHIDVLVNNAGYMTLGTLEDVEPKALEQQPSTNVPGAANMTRATMPRRKDISH
jgi:NAD(P)-dependent dehydrogenase (short-subunit alcohol dehydrogenase family)